MLLHRLQLRGELRLPRRDVLLTGGQLGLGGSQLRLQGLLPLGDILQAAFERPQWLQFLADRLGPLPGDSQILFGGAEHRQLVLELHQHGAQLGAGDDRSLGRRADLLAGVGGPLAQHDELAFGPLGGQALGLDLAHPGRAVQRVVAFGQAAGRQHQDAGPEGWQPPPGRREARIAGWTRGHAPYHAPPFRTNQSEPRTNPMERTLILLKPDALQRGIAGQILARFEQKGLKIVGMKLMQITPALAAKHYEAHKERPFYPGLVKFMTSSPVVALALEGLNAIAICRKLMGKTNAADAEPGTIRGDFGMSRSYNLVHGSDGPEAAERELGLFFPEGLVAYDFAGYQWLYDPVEELKK